MIPSLAAQDALVNLRQSPGQLVDVELNANGGPDVDASRMEAVPHDDDDWDFKGAVGLNEVERVVFKRRFFGLQKT